MQYWQAIQLARLHNRLRPVLRRDAKRAKLGARHLRAKHSRSMMNSNHPAGLKSVIQPDRRTARLLAAHTRRQSAGWVRG